jgi:hypothetical protein
MRKFVYRAPRFPVNFLVQVTVGDSTVVARCLQISNDGMELEGLMDSLPGSCGMVAVNHKGIKIELEVRVVRSESQFGGLEFIYKSEDERTKMAHFVASVAGTPDRPGPKILA